MGFLYMSFGPIFLLDFFRQSFSNCTVWLFLAFLVRIFLMQSVSALEVYQAGELTVIGFGGREVLDDMNVAECRDELVHLIREHHCTVMAFDLTRVRLVPSGLLGLLASIQVIRSGKVSKFPSLWLIRRPISAKCWRLRSSTKCSKCTRWTSRLLNSDAIERKISGSNPSPQALDIPRLVSFGQLIETAAQPS